MGCTVRVTTTCSHAIGLKKGLVLKRLVFFLVALFFWFGKVCVSSGGDKHVHICYTCSQHLGVVVLLDTVYYIFSFCSAKRKTRTHPSERPRVATKPTPHLAKTKRNIPMHPNPVRSGFMKLLYSCFELQNHIWKC
jgi:hypothetical protein